MLQKRSRKKVNILLGKKTQTKEVTIVTKKTKKNGFDIFYYMELMMNL